MNILIMGCGRSGATLAALLDSEGHKVTVLDISGAGFRRLPPTFHGTVVLGDGTDEDVLRNAGISEADAFVAVTQGDNRNIMAAQIARVIFKTPKVLCRIYDPLRENLYKNLGVQAISPTKIFSELMRDQIVG
ncbi:MAG: TrkA family potassium uptake protein [Dehalococcoidia bacterium]|nr:TrkA family potassium uptake protein [Dehalococcoidia bacterium]MDZ4247350.1 TrkA family potassium uptake protein [Dehalococcoidia bacterium]